MKGYTLGKIPAIKETTVEFLKVAIANKLIYNRPPIFCVRSRAWPEAVKLAKIKKQPFLMK